MTTSNKGLKFGSFEDLDPEVNKRILSFLKSGSEPPSLKLYWETPVSKYNTSSVKSAQLNALTVVPDIKPVSGGGDSPLERPPSKSVLRKEAASIVIVSSSGDTSAPTSQIIPPVLDEPIINSQPSFSQDVDNECDGWAGHSGGRSEGHLAESQPSHSPSSQANIVDSCQPESSRSEGQLSINRKDDSDFSESPSLEGDQSMHQQHEPMQQPQPHHKQSADQGVQVHTAAELLKDYFHSPVPDYPPPSVTVPTAVPHETDVGSSDNPNSESKRSDDLHSDSCMSEVLHSECGTQVPRHDEVVGPENRHSECGRPEGRNSESREHDFNQILTHGTKQDSYGIEPRKLDNNTDVAGHQSHQQHQIHYPPQLMHQQQQVMQQQPMQHQQPQQQPMHQHQQLMQHQSMQQHQSVHQQRHQPMQQPQPHHKQSAEQRVQAHTAAGLFKNYFPPPVSDYPPPTVTGPTAVPRENLGPHGVRPSPHVEASYNVPSPQRYSDEQTRGHVDDTGVYHRPTGGPSPVAVPGQSPLSGVGGKIFERRNKKKRPVDYYERMSQSDQNQIQNMGNMPAGYHQMSASVSVRQAMEAPTSGSYVNVAGSQPGAGVLSSQYGQMQHQAIMNSGLMYQMILQQRHQVNTPPQQYFSHQELATRMAMTAQNYQPNYSHAPHIHHAHPNIYHGQPAVANPSVAHNLRAAAAGIGQCSPGRSIPMSPAGLAPSQHGLLGRSPPHTSPILPGYPDARMLEHGYSPQAHQLQQSPTASAQLLMLQGPLLNSTNAFSGSLSNVNTNAPAHKEAIRTSGPPRVPVMVTSPLHQPPQISTFIPSPQHHESKSPSAHTVTMAPFLPPALHDVSDTRADGVHTETAPAPEISLLNKLEVSGLVVLKEVPEIQRDKVPLDLSPKPQPMSPVILTDKQAILSEVPQTVDLQDEVDGMAGSNVDSDVGNNSDTNAGGAGPAEASPASAHMPEPRAENENEDMCGDSASAAKSSFTLRFGTVRDIATMNAQPVSEVVKHTAGEYQCQHSPAVVLGGEGEVVVGDGVMSPASAAPRPECTSVTATAAAATSPVAAAAPDVRPDAPATQSSPPPPPPSPPPPPPTDITEVSSPHELPNVPKSTVSMEKLKTERPTAVVHPISTSSVLTTSVPVITKPAEPTPVPSPPNVNTQAPVLPPSALDTPKPKMWSSLFNSGKAAPGGVTGSTAVPVPNHATAVPGVVRKADEKDSSKELKKPVATVDDSRAKALGDFLLSYTVKYNSVSLQPRGLYNRSNWCYINATLQALLACPALYQMMKALPLYKQGTRGSTSTPVMDCMVQFVNEYTEMAPQQLRHIEKSSGKGPIRSNTDVRHGQPFEPVNILKMLQVIQYNTSFKYGHQEDAEEFMSCILNALHDEMVACMNTARPEAPPEDKAKENGETGTAERATGNADEDDQWEQVGPKNKSIVTRSAKLKQSPISDVFGGQMRSVFHAPGQKESATLQPFFCLQLDVQSEKVWTVEDALDGQAAKEIIHGYTDSTTKQEVEAYRRLFIDDLPPILIMHLKCFIYLQSGGAQKVIKNFEFKTDLTIAKDLMSPNARSKFPAAKRNYELFAVVNHHGTRVVGGHYTADVFHSGLQLWIRLDDSTVRVISADKVVQFEPPRFPYLLYYRRKDLN